MNSRSLLFSLIFFPLQALIKVPKELITEIATEKIHEYSNQVIILDAYGYVKSIYRLEENRLVKSLVPKEICTEEFKDSLILQNTAQVPEQCLTISYKDKLEKRYWLRNNTLHQEIQNTIPFGKTAYCPTEEMLFSSASKADIRIISNYQVNTATENYCTVMTEKHFKSYEKNSLESLKKKHNFSFAPIETQKRIANLVQAAIPRLPIAVYEYNENENQSSMTFRTGIKLILNDTNIPVIGSGSRWIIVINKSTNRQLERAILYHEMGHIRNHDLESNNSGKAISPKERREQEYLADEYVYAKLSEENALQELVHYFLFLCDEITIERELITSPDKKSYQQDQENSVHPASWQRASKCLDAIKKIVKPLDNCLLTEAFIKNLEEFFPDTLLTGAIDSSTFLPNDALQEQKVLHS